MTYKELQDAFVELTFLLRGLDYNSNDEKVQNLVRLSYSHNSQPFQQYEDEISYLWVTYSDSRFNNQINEKKKIVNNKLELTKTQLRNLNVMWTFYGESSQDLAFYFRQSLFSNKAKNFLDKYGIKLITDIPEVVSLFENVNSTWWPRVDLTVNYYIETEMKEEENPIEAVSIEIATETKRITIQEVKE